MGPMKHTVVRTLLFCATLWILACGPSDPRIEVLEQRARWEVRPLEWVVTPEGDVSLSARVTGPPNAKIEKLTLRVDLTDSGGQVHEHWHTFDLTKIARGGPKDVVLRIPAGGFEVDSLSLYMAYAPTADDEPHIAELQGLPASSD